MGAEMRNASQKDFKSLPDQICVFCVHQVINGLLERPDWEEAIRTPLGILPGGSGNALAASIHHYSGWVTCRILNKTIHQASALRILMQLQYCSLTLRESDVSLRTQWQKKQKSLPVIKTRAFSGLVLVDSLHNLIKRIWWSGNLTIK